MRFASFLRVFCCLVFTLLTLSAVQLPAAQAATRTVTNSTDNNAGSLRQTIAAASAGDTVFISIGGPITLTSGQITIDKNLIIEAGDQRVTISGNNVSRIFNITSGVTVELRNLNIINGRAETGGAIISLGTLTISNSIFSGNNATNGTGGAISNNNINTFTIINSNFSSNSSTGGGGAIHNTGPLTITGSTFNSNGNTGVQAGAGGAVFNIGGAMNITNSTFFNNSSQGFGGGAISASEPTFVDSSTFLNNGGVGNLGIVAIDANATISRSIISGSACFSFNGSITDGGNNIGFNTTDCVGANVDPLLGVLNYYGGKTPTIVLQAGSPALDMYTTGCLATDQRGTARPQGAACDIGAFELVPNTLTVSNLNDSGLGSLRDTISVAPPGYTINFGMSGTVPVTSGQIVIDKNLTIDGTGQSIVISGNNTSRLFQINSGTTVEIRNLVRMQNGRTTTEGGGVFSNRGNLTLSNFNISGSALLGGGAIYNNANSTLTLNNVTLSGNSATGVHGGALYTENATVTINNSNITSNTAPTSYFGGGIYQLGGTMNINNSFFSYNRGGSGGGAIASSGGIINIRNSTFLDNSATVSGGAFYCYNSCVANMDSNTFVRHGNTPTGATIDQTSSTVTLKHSIISTGACNGSIIDGGNNIAYNAAGCPGTNVDPLLFIDQGLHGGTTNTFALRPNSPAIDAYSTNCLTTDQRGVSRAQGAACDIGAYEVYRGTLTVTNLNDSGAGSLRDAIAAATSDTTINFSVSGTITLASMLIASKNITIDGSGQTVTLDGNNAVQIIRTSGVYYIHIRNLSLINGFNTQGMPPSGGAISSTYLNIDNSTFANNRLNYGGVGGAASANYLVVNNSTFTGNSVIATGNGGAISAYNMVVNNSTFSNNSVSNGSGGAIYSPSIVGGARVTINNSTFSNNSSANSGGAIALTSGITVLGNNTFSANSASTSGGAIHAIDELGPHTITASNNTFANNTAATGGAIFTLLDFVGSTATISTSIFNGGSCSATLTDGGNNIAFNATGCVGINVDPLLGVLGDYGGTTQTIPLLVGSPAIDAYSTNCPATDQRGITRPQGAACDIGAFEVVPIIITEATVTENEFFAALNAARTGYPDISSIIVDFVPNGINLTLITNSGTVGVVSFQLTQGQGFVTFATTSVTVNGAAAPASYLTIINHDLPNILTTALDALVVERFGSLIDINSMTIDSSTMTINTAP